MTVHCNVDTVPINLLTEIFYLQFFSSFKPAWATEQWVNVWCLLSFLRVIRILVSKKLTPSSILTKIVNILPHWSVAQAGSNDEDIGMMKNGKGIHQDWEFALLLKIAHLKSDCERITLVTLSCEQPWANRSCPSVKKSSMSDFLVIWANRSQKLAIRSTKFIFFICFPVFHCFPPFLWPRANHSCHSSLSCSF